jgi:two-component system, LuxR family, response regulator FixJ
MDQSAGATVFIIDDDSDVRQLVQQLVESVGLKAESFSSADGFLAAYQPDRAGCLVTDVRLPGMSGLELQEALARRKVLLPIIVVTGHADVPLAVRAMRSQALDVLEKPFSKQVLLDRVQEAIRVDAERRRIQATTSQAAARAATLTRREREIMNLVVQGLANKQMAFQLELSEKTIETHRSRVMKKMDVDSVAELVRLALSLDVDAGNPSGNADSGE